MSSAHPSDTWNSLASFLGNYAGVSGTAGGNRNSLTEHELDGVRPVEGKPDPKHISTSFVERQNHTMRMHMRRFTRLTNGFSKKIENHASAVALHFMHYNFVRIHKTIKVTPAMAAEVTDKLWEIADIIKMSDEYHDANNSN